MKNPVDASPFCHISIPASDLEKAKTFYESVFGWTVKVNIPGPKYWFFESGNVGGAFSGNGVPTADSVMLFLQVEDMQTTIERIMEYGGTITQYRSAIGDASPGFDAHFLIPMEMRWAFTRNVKLSIRANRLCKRFHFSQF